MNNNSTVSCALGSILYKVTGSGALALMYHKQHRCFTHANAEASAAVLCKALLNREVADEGNTL